MVHTLDHIAEQRREAQAAVMGSGGSSFIDAWRDALSSLTSGGTTPSTEQDPAPSGDPQPPAFTPQGGPTAEEILAQIGWGTGGGYDPFSYFTSGAEYWARQGAEAAEYISNIPGEAGEAGGEFLAGVGAGAGAGIGSLVDPLTAIPGDLFKNIPIWVPVLGAAFLLTR